MIAMRAKKPAVLLVLLSLAAAGAAAQETPAREPLSAASRQWLEEVVPYIITSAEKEVFLILKTEKQRGEFIESFWRKRDPDPSTPENEVKLEYYKRIAQANKIFSTSGLAGWRTDRGRIYILLGPPKEVQRDFGGQGSGLSAFTGPKETWQYWNLPNPKLPYNMEFVFVDRFGTGSYVLDRSFRADRGRDEPFDQANVTFQFDSLELMSEALKNPFENLGNLKGVITAEVDYDLVPFSWEAFAFKGAPKQTYLPLLVQVPYASMPVRKLDEVDLVSLNLTVNVSDALGRVVFGTSRDVNFRRTAGERGGFGGAEPGPAGGPLSGAGGLYVPPPRPRQLQRQDGDLAQGGPGPGIRFRRARPERPHPFAVADRGSATRGGKSGRRPRPGRQPRRDLRRHRARR